MVTYRYLAIKTTLGWSTQITYILFPTKMQKGKATKIDLPLLKNDITKILKLRYLRINCRNQKFEHKKDRAISDPASVIKSCLSYRGATDSVAPSVSISYLRPLKQCPNYGATKRGPSSHLLPKLRASQLVSLSLCVTVQISGTNYPCIWNLCIGLSSNRCWLRTRLCCHHNLRTYR